MTGWSDLVTTALLGLDRRPLADDPAEPWLASVGDDPDPAGRLLDRAALYRAAVRTGRASPPVPEPPAPPGGQGPVAPPAVQQLLDRLLLRPDRALISRWLDGCAHHGLTVAPQLWTRLADHLNRHDGNSAATVRAVVGVQGIWFLNGRERWSRLLARLAPEPSQAGPARVDPGAVRARRERLNREALRAVQIVVDHRGQASVVVTPPVVDAQLQADGVSPRPPASLRIGAGAHVVRQLLAAADADLWPASWQRSPGQILALVQRTVPQWRDDLCEGWAAATLLDQHAGWAEALTEVGYRGSRAPAIYGLVPLERRHLLMADWLAADRPAELIMELVLSFPEPWSRAVTGSALQLLGSGSLGRSATAYAGAVGARLAVADQLDVRAAAEYYLEDAGRPPASRWTAVRDAFAALAQAMELRAEIEDLFPPRCTTHRRDPDDVHRETRSTP